MSQQTDVSNQHDNNILDRRIMSTIRFYTNQISKIFKLSRNDKDDVRQRLMLTALQAEQTYDPSCNTKFRTYIKTAISFDAVDIMRKLERAPQVVCFEEGYDLQETEVFYQNCLRDIHDEITNPGAPRQKKMIQFNCGSHMQTIAVAPVSIQQDFKIDAAMVLGQLKFRERIICKLLAKGLTRQEIANRLGIHMNTVRRRIANIQKLFRVNGFENY